MPHKTETDAPGATPVRRGCGERVSDGVYAECGLGAGGAPVEDFLIDPPCVVPKDLPIASLGIQLIERDGVTHIIDWVGSEHYPNVADFIEEVRRFGMSRRLPSNLDFARITPESRHLLVHARAYIGNAHQYEKWTCPQRRADHAPVAVLREYLAQYQKTQPALCCAGLWWRDIEGGEPYDPARDADLYCGLQNAATNPRGPKYAGRGANAHPVTCDDPRTVRRVMPSFDYFAQATPDNITPQYKPAFFASFPISRLVVVRGQKSAETLDKMYAASVPVAEVHR